jgi:peptidoglycan/xylan/chitin deacetylase (PgdA/CDA1 family)
LPKNSVAITIDDGFYSTARVAIPILEKYKFPATLYATTYYMQHPHPIFRLVVQYMFWKTRLTNAAFSGYLGLEGAFDLTNASGNDALVWRIIEHGERNCSEDERRSICVRLGQLLDVSYDEIAQSRILDLLTPSELRAATMSGVNIELHTHRHRFPKDDESGALREIADNRRALQAWLPGAFTHFCYPSGLHDERQWPWLQASGIVTATTCLPGSNSRRTPRNKLRRLLDAHAVHPLEFEASLSGFSDLLTGRIMTA